MKSTDIIDLDQPLPNTAPEAPPREILPPSVSTVPAHWPQASSWKFEGFALEITPWLCKCCGDKTVHSQLFRLFVRHFPETTDRRKVPATEFVPQHPVIRYEMLTKTTELCAKCVDTQAGEKHFRICDENEFRLAAAKAREELSASRPRKSNVVSILTKGQIASKLENLI